MKKYEVAYYNVDEPVLPPEVYVTTDFAYFGGRVMVKSMVYYRYKKEELEPWIPQLKEKSSKVKRIYGYFNNNFQGYTVENCQVLEMLGILASQQYEAKKKAEEHFNPKMKKSSLDQFF